MTGGYGRNGTEIGVALSSVRAYFEAEGWVDLSSLPVPRWHHCQVTVDNAVYVIGGKEGVDWNDPPQSSVFILSEGQEWVKGSSLPTPLSQHSCVVIGSKINVVGGYNDDKVEGSSVYILDTSTTGSSWESGPALPEPRANAQAVVSEDTLYLFGGMYKTDVFTLTAGDQAWSVVPDSNITDHRVIFPAPFITSDVMHCK